MKKHPDTRPEVLAPVGSFDALLAAVEGGADAVYLGYEKFNARASADNFGEDTLRRAVRYAHAHGVCVYMTMNTLLYDRELDEALDIARRAEGMGIDALIVADMGLFSRLRQACPALPLHVSTQAGIHSAEGLREMARMGATRVVLARELSEGDLTTRTALAASLGIEIEVFVHGAHCVSVSGQCLFSAMIGGRSGNRGECAQPCRLPYGAGYPLSLMDLSLSAHVSRLTAMGVSSFKIEGRLKSPHYVYTATSIFRRLVDENRGATAKERHRLAESFSRGGDFTDGYFCKATDHMTAVRTDADKENSRRAEEGYVPSEYKLPVRIRFTAKSGQPLVCTLETERLGATVEGITPQAARSVAITAASVADHLAKMGDTPLTVDRDASDFQVEDGLFIPVSALNDLRRRAVDALLLSPLVKRNDTDRTSDTIACREVQRGPHEPTVNTVILTMRTPQLQAAQRFFEKSAHKPLLFLSYLALTEADTNLTLPDGVWMPPVITSSEAVRATLASLRARGVRYAMIENQGQYEIAADAGLSVYGGMRLNLTNRAACDRFVARGGIDAILSPELKTAQARDIGFGMLLIYGHLPLMLTERCFIRENFGCAHCDRAALTDRMRVSFPMMREWEHRNVILNSRPTYMLDRQAELHRMKLTKSALLFTKENHAETLDILDRFMRRMPPDSDVRRIK